MGHHSWDTLHGNLTWDTLHGAPYMGHYMGHPTRDTEHETLNMGHHNTLHGTPYMGHHTWDTVHGTPRWDTIHGAPYMGPWAAYSAVHTLLCGCLAGCFVCGFPNEILYNCRVSCGVYIYQPRPVTRNSELANNVSPDHDSNPHCCHSAYCCHSVFSWLLEV